MKSTSKVTVWQSKLMSLAAMLALAGVRTATATDYPSTILADNPSAYYRLEELPGAGTAVDSSINNVGAAYNYNADSSSPLLGLPGITTNSIAFNGGGWSGNYGFVGIPASSYITPLANDGIHGAPFSCELWVQPTGQPATYSVPIEMAQYPNGWNIYVSGADANGGTSYFYLNMPNGVLFQGFADFPISFPSIWYHLVVTYDGSSVKFYINGVSHGPYAVAYSPAIGFDCHVGSGQGVGWQPFIGGVDEVAFYTNVLSAGQVQNHYQVGTNSFRAAYTKPGIVSGPSSTTNYSGLPVSFTVNPSGTQPLHYQWLKNNTPVGPNSSTYGFTCQYPADDNASIQVIITNNYGSVTSTPAAMLSVLTNDVIANPPGSITRNVGSHAAFYVTAYGALPISYQWARSTDGGSTFTPIPGATSAALWLTNVQMGQSGYQYQATVIGPFSSTVAPAATLNVQARAVNVPLTGYAAIVAADQPVAYWRLDENNGATTAVDAVGTFDGDYTPNAGSITYGVLPPGIPNDTDPAVTLAGGATIQIPFAPELNPTTPWSVETWVKPSSLGANGGDYRVVLSSEYNLYPNPYNGWYIYQQPNNSFAFVPQPGNAFITGGSLVAGNWYYLVITDDGVNFNMYINGVLATAPFPVASAGFTPNGAGINPDGTAGITPGLGNTVLGQRTDGAFGTFLGTIDDTAIYQYALSPQQIMSHYTDTTTITIKPIAGNKVVLTWPVGNLQAAPAVSGTYTNVPGATSPYTASVGAAPLFFRVNVP